MKKKSNKITVSVIASFLLSIYLVNVSAQLIYESSEGVTNASSEVTLSPLMVLTSNLRVIDDEFVIAPNIQTPVSQVEPFKHSATVQNIGTDPQTNVNLSITIVDDATGNEVFMDNNPLSTVLPNTTVGGQAFPNDFTPDGLTPTSYTGTYEVTSDSADISPSDNTQTYSFMTSDTVFAKESGPSLDIRPADSNWDDGEPHSWAYGNYYRIVNGDNWNASSVSFTIGNGEDPDMEGRLLIIYLYRWIGDFNQDGAMDPDERERVGFNVYEIQGTESQTDLITVPLLTFPSGDVGGADLESNEDYVVMVEYQTFDEVNFSMMVGSVDFRPMTALSVLDGAPRYSSLIALGAILEDESFSTIGFNAPFAPVVRLNISSLQIEIIGESSNISCNGECSGSIGLEVSGGSSNYTYSWVGPDGYVADTEDITDLCPGQYDVTITDSQGNTEEADFLIEEPLEINLDFEYTVLPCAVPCENSINLTLTNGTSPFGFEWFDSFGTLISTSEDLSNVCPGSYVVNITDANGCLIEDIAEIVDPAFPVATGTIQTPECFGLCSGSIDLEINGGTSPHSYQWSGGLAPVQDQTDMCAGNYTVTIIDDVGCQNVLSIEISEPLELSDEVIVTNPTCFEACDGLAMISVSGGTAPYSFTGDFDDLCAGGYSVTVTDMLGCTLISDFMIDETTQISVNVDSIGNEVNSMDDGFVNITPEGGTPPYSFIWSNAAGFVSMEEDPSGLMAGIYELEITDSAGCVYVLSDIIVDDIVAVAEIGLSNSLSVFPNPTMDIINVKFDLEESVDVDFAIYDVTGRLVESRNESKISSQLIVFDIGQYSQGVYTLKVRIDGVFIVEKIIKYD